MEFCKNGTSIILSKENGESDKMFFERGNFIISQKINNFEFLNKLSKIYVNIKFKGCTYPYNITRIVRDMESNMAT